MIVEGGKKYNMSETVFVNVNVKQEIEDSDCIDDKNLEYKDTININTKELMDYENDDTIRECKIFTAVGDIKMELSTFEVPDNSINVKVENGICAVDKTNTEFSKGLYFCEHCHAYYDGYCTKCGVLLHILNSNICKSAQEIPTNILEIRDSFGQNGIFSLRVIPEGVKFGPFSGFSLSNGCRKLKMGKFIVTEEHSKYLNWMQYVNSVRSSCEKSLVVFEYEDNLYYRSARQIDAGEELLVYFGEEYEGSFNNDNEMDFTPIVEEDYEDVFACTFCSLGFRSRLYLAQHKSTCRNKIDEHFSSEELIQCPLCKIYLDGKEYRESHMTYCRERSNRKYVPLTLNSQEVEEARRKIPRRRFYKCTHCNYRTAYKGELKSHTNQHYQVRTYKCSTCSGRFNTKKALKAHIAIAKHDGRNHVKTDCITEKFHANVENSKHQRHLQGDEKLFECSECPFITKHTSSLKRHVQRTHLEAGDHACTLCDFKSNAKERLKYHIKTKHLKKFDYWCENCNYKTNVKVDYETHVKSKHLKEFSYECDTCNYKTNSKAHLERHIKGKHLKLLNYKCDVCEYKTYLETYLEMHVKRKHTKEYDYGCDICYYKTSVVENLEYHVKTKHLKQFKYKCDVCDYATNGKVNLEQHTKTKHLKQFDYKCDKCDFETNMKVNIERHAQRKHPKELNYKCTSCDYRTNIRSNLDQHLKEKHLKVLNHVCTMCEYKTNHKRYLENHMAAKHLKEFNFKCANCDYRSYSKASLDNHVKNKHLKEFKHKCASCDYVTNIKSHFGRHVNAKHLK